MSAASTVPKNRVPRLVALALALFLALPVAAPAADPGRWDYADMFDLVREVMHRKPARKFLNELFADQLKVDPKTAERFGFTKEKVANFTENQLLTLIQEVPSIRPTLRAYLKAVPLNAETETQTPELKALREEWRRKFRELFAQDKKSLDRFLKKSDPLKPFVMELPPGQTGFPEIDEFFTHALEYEDGTIRAADDVEQAIVDFIDGAKHQFRFNVFDFDSPKIADAIIRAHKRGVDVMGGIDKGVIEERPEVKAIYDRLVAEKIPVQPVDSVGLDHQKLAVRDWDFPELAATSMSSGNWTISCVGARGDGTRTAIESVDAIPNANSMRVVRGQTTALVVHHDLTKTIDPRYAYRGREYPMNGAFFIHGRPEADGAARWFIVAFTPNGALGSVNQNVIARMIKLKKGPKYFAQFAFSSKEVERALLEDAIESKRKGLPFEMHGICDTPFAMQTWSICLSISGFELRGEGKTKEYLKIADKDNAWLKALGKERYEEVLKHIRVAPPAYGTRTVRTPDGPFKLTAKMHHKVLCIGPPGDQLCIFGSFNFSAGAESNQEYITVFRDRKTNRSLTAVVETFEKKSKETVVQEALRRNRAHEFDPDTGPEVEAAKAGRSSTDVKVKCKNLLRPANVAGFVK